MKPYTACVHHAPGGSPFVRKISVILLEKRIPFEFVNESPYSESNGVARYNPLGKVPALVTDDGECWFDSPVIAQYLELLGVAPPMIPADPRAALRMRQLEALADGVMEAAQALVREKARPGAQQSEQELLRQREKVARGLDRLEACAADGTLRGDEVNLATISTACAIAYLNFRRVAPGWCATRPQLVKLVDALFQRASFARTEPPRT
ncbi:glutathione S-transferase [Klebsiella pneumoniae]